MTLSLLTSNHTDNMIGWKIVDRKNQATTTQKNKHNFSEASSFRPYLIRSNQGAKRVPGHTDRRIWFGRRDSLVGFQQDGVEVVQNYHSRAHSITTIIMLITVFVFVTTLVSAAVLVCWCKKQPGDKGSTGKRRSKRTFRNNLAEDFRGAKDDDDDNDEVGDDDDDDDNDDDKYDVETCEMREIFSHQPHDVSDEYDDRRSDESDSDFGSSNAKAYTKLPFDEDFNRTSPISEDKPCRRDAEHDEDHDIVENEFMDIKPARVKSKYRLLNCIAPNLLRKLTLKRHLVVESGDFLQPPNSSDHGGRNHSTDSCYFVNHSFAVERHFLNPLNTQSKFFDKFFSRLRFEGSPAEEVFKLSRHDSSQSLL